jgi:glyoxalase family protein
VPEVASGHAGEVKEEEVMQLTGIHHLTAVTAKAKENIAFYTQTLGLRLVKKTVNQDDVSSYHFFYADGKGSPGTDITFFDWPTMRERRGGRSIVRTGMRVPVASLDYWGGRLEELNVANGGAIVRDGRHVIEVEDFEGQRLTIVGDDRAGAGNPWEKSPVPAEHQVRGLGPITISVAEIRATDSVLTGLMGMRKAREFASVGSNGGDEATVHVYEMGPGGANAELHVMHEPLLERARLGSGGVHHVAFRVPTFEEYDAWNARLREFGVQSSGPVDRFYFRSLYFREPHGILFELATDGPGFASDEPMESLGEKLALPPFLEGRRAEIEAGLKPV